MTITRKEFAAILREKNQFSMAESGEFLEMVFEIMRESLEKGEKIKISGFGNFAVKEKRARRGRNPKTGEALQISARRIVTFKPSLILRKALNRGGQ
jgi:integration host factor subunit alpha